MSSHRVLVATGCLWIGIAGAAAPGWAVDGVLEVNQGCMAVGCFTGDLPGFPVTLPSGASYRLTSDLVSSSGDVTIIEGSSGGLLTDNGTIDLDLNGFSVRCFVQPQVGSCEGLGIGIDFGTISGASIRNGTVRNMGNHGILIGRAGYVHAVRLLGNGSGAPNASGVHCPDSCQISSCEFWGNSQGANTGELANVLDNLFDGNGTGLRLGWGGLASRNTIRNSAGTGLGVQGGPVGIFQNVITQSGGFGIGYFGAVVSYAYGQNALSGNNGAGPEVEGGAAAIQVGPNFCDNALCP
jgi:hypothetical protein